MQRHDNAGAKATPCQTHPEKSGLIPGGSNQSLVSLLGVVHGKAASSRRTQGTLGTAIFLTAGRQSRIEYASFPLIWTALVYDRRPLIQ